jgi:FADH2 O2-dependent halogenase
VQALDLDEYSQLFRAAAQEVEAVRDQARPVNQAASRIYELLNNSGLCPDYWNVPSAENRCPSTFTLFPLLRFVAWGRRRTPEAIRKHYFLTRRTKSLLSDFRKNVIGEFLRVNRMSGRVLRDVVCGWNQDWRQIRTSGHSQSSATEGQYQVRSVGDNLEPTPSR